MSVDQASLQFGLVPLSSSSSLLLRLGNHSNCGLTVELRQSVRERERGRERKEEAEDEVVEVEEGEKAGDESRIIMV